MKVTIILDQGEAEAIRREARDRSLLATAGMCPLSPADAAIARLAVAIDRELGQKESAP